MTTMNAGEDHERWAELAAGRVLASLDESDEALYLKHAAHCRLCQQLERDLSETLSDLAHLPAQVTPPPSLRASIIRAAIEDDEKRSARAVTSDGASSSGKNTVIEIAEARRDKRKPAAWVAAAAAVVLAAGGIAWSLSGHPQASVAARCAKTHCPTVALDADGRRVATVMVLDKTVYLQAAGLPPTPTARSYVLWRISDGRSPVGVAAVRTEPAGSPVSAGALAVPISDVDGFALSEEAGDAVPAAPTHVIAHGNLG